MGSLVFPGTVGNDVEDYRTSMLPPCGSADDHIVDSIGFDKLKTCK
jgi:hypothetical protein